MTNMTELITALIDILAMAAFLTLVGYVFYKEAELQEEDELADRRANFTVRQIITKLP